MRANQSRGSSPASNSPTPREQPQPTASPAPSKPVVDSGTPVVAVDTKPSSERHPQRREGNLDATDVKVIRTTARDVRRRNREAREAEEKRLSQAGSSGATLRRTHYQKADQTSGHRAGIQESRPAASPRTGKPAEENSGRKSSAPKNSAKTSASARELAEGARGSLAQAAEYVRTHVRLTIAVCVLVLAVVSLYGPVRDYYVAWRRQGDLQAQYDELSNDHDNLQSDVDRLQSREGIEDEARRQGYGYGDEDTLSVEGVDDDPNQGSSPLDTQDDTTEDVPWYVHVGDVIFFYSPDSQG